MRIAMFALCTGALMCLTACLGASPSGDASDSAAGGTPGAVQGHQEPSPPPALDCLGLAPNDTTAPAESGLKLVARLQGKSADELIALYRSCVEGDPTK